MNLRSSFTQSAIFGWLRHWGTLLLTRFRVSENSFMAAVAVVIGLIAGLCNYLFRQTIELVNWLFMGNGMELFEISFDEWSFSRILLIIFPVIGGVIMIPMRLLFREDLKFGFSRFLETVNLGGGKIRPRIIFTRGFASAVTIGTGGSAGQEGPIAQIGGAVGSLFGQMFKMSGTHIKTMIACGASGGVAATFNAPIAGVFFAHEIILLSSFELSSFTSIVISSGMATVVSRALLGNHAEFIVPPYHVGTYWELVFYVLLGLIIGAVGAFFIDLHFRIKDRFDALDLSPLLKPLLGGLMVGAIGVFFPQIFGNGYEFIDEVLHGQGVWYLLAALILIKAIATSVTIGSGLPGGLFAPSLYIGAVTGGSFGHIMNALFPSVVTSPGSYALVGMGAFLAAVTHAPMTAIFLLFEITASYQVIVPIMLSCVIGTAIARHFRKTSIETEELARAGINLEAGKERNIMKSLRVGEVMSTNPESIPESMTLRQFTDFVARTRHTNFPLLDREGRMTGIISVQDFMGVAFERDLMDLIVVKELATTEVITVCEDDDLDTALRRIGYRNIEQLPVVSRDDASRLVGIIARRDIISAYNRALMTRNLREEAV